MILLLTYLALALAISFVCSMLEAILLSVPLTHVAVLVERGNPAGLRLREMKEDVDRPLASILTLNTFAHTLGAAGVGAQATLLWGDAWVGVVSMVVTLLILIISEIIPKTLGATHAKSLAPFAAWTIQGMIVMLYPLVALCNGISNLLSRGKESVPAVSREEVGSLARIARKEGAITPKEAHVIRNLIALRETAVVEVMTPRVVLFTFDGDETVRSAVGGEPPRFARIPVVGESVDDIVGLVNRHQLFEAFATGQAHATMDELAKPVHVVPETAKLPVVLDEFILRREHLFVAVDEHGGTSGIVTLEDVMESLLGVEIMDETDTVADMQALARQATMS